MKLTIRKIALLIIIAVFFKNISSQTYDWEDYKITDIPADAIFGTNNNDWDIAVDNFGVHFVGLYGLAGFDDKGTLKYSLVDNNGVLRNSNNDVGSNGKNITAVSLCTYKGKAYITAAYWYAADIKIKIYHQANAFPITNSWSLLGEYIAYEGPIQNYVPRWIDTYADEYGLHIVYGFVDGGECGHVYYMNYKITENRWANLNGLGPRIELNNISNCKGSPNLTVSNKNNIKRVHIVTGFGNFYTRDLRFNSYDEIVVESEISTNYWGLGIHEAEYTGFDYCTPVVDPKQNGKLFLIASLGYQQGRLYTDSRLKSRDIEVQSWTTNEGILNEYDYIGNVFPQSAFYDGYTGGVIPVCYGYERGPLLQEYKTVEYKEFFINGNYFSAYTKLFDERYDFFEEGNLMKADSQGVYVAIHARPNNNPKIIFKRKPREYRNDIVYNSLWTGNTYISATQVLHSAGADIVAEAGSITILKPNTHLVVDNNDYLYLRGGSSLILESGSQLYFRGANSYMKLDPGATVTMSPNSNIYFDNEARLEANGATFTMNWPSDIDIWNAGNNTVVNGCNFLGSFTYLGILNDDYTINNSIDITNNYFENSAVYICNTLNLDVSSNTFSRTGGAGIPMVEICDYNSTSPENSPSGSIRLNIIGNNFRGGESTIQLTVWSLAGSMSPFYIYGNTFAGLSGAERSGFYLGTITGDFKENQFSDNNFLYSGFQYFSNINYFQNTLKSSSNNSFDNYANFNLEESATANLAPLSNGEGQLVWYGGANKLYLSNTDPNLTYSNISFTIGCNVFTDQGSNCFNLDYINQNKHIKGRLARPCSGQTFYTRQNFWSPYPPLFDITCDGQPVNVVYLPIGAVCPDMVDLNKVGYQLVDKGGGVFDTIWITVDYPSGPGGGSFSGNGREDERLYSYSINNKNSKSYSEAISKLKTLINNFDSSKFLIPSLSELYLNYEYSDSVVSNRNILFTGLENYLQEKIQHYFDKPKFVERAYNFFLKCLVKLKNYDEAIAGYENIMINHPDPIVRLHASWDRAAVILLKNGGSGGGYPLSGCQIQSKKRVKLLDNKPAHQIAKEVFRDQKTIGESTQRNYSKSQLNELTNRITYFAPSNFKELRSKVNEDIMFITHLSDNRNETQLNDLLPKYFKLYQNYPNPFNPKSTIKFDVPKQTNLSITLYDLTGKQIVVLINDLKQPGTYEIEFDGTNLSSGVYFYELVAGTFAETKKMVLIK